MVNPCGRGAIKHRARRVIHKGVVGSNRAADGAIRDHGILDILHGGHTILRTSEAPVTNLEQLRGRLATPSRRRVGSVVIAQRQSGSLGPGQDRGIVVAIAAAVLATIQGVLFAENKRAVRLAVTGFDQSRLDDSRSAEIPATAALPLVLDRWHQSQGATVIAGGSRFGQTLPNAGMA